MTQKTSKANKDGHKVDALEYALDYEYEGTPHRASRIGNNYYGYDANGNLVSERFGNTGATPSREHPLYEEDGVYSTDYGFALTAKDPGEGSGGGTNERSYEWNERNQLRQSKDTQWTVQYRYGADGQRAIKYATQGGRSYNETLYFNKMLQVGKIQKYDKDDIESKHIYVGETRIVTKQRSVGNDNYGQETENQYYYHGDHLGSAQVVTNYKGELYEHLEYTPYGELWIERTAEEGNLLPFRFTAKEYDRETGLYYYGARYLDPRTSRWISTDPAMGEYIPGAPINDEVRKRNQNLPGMGGVFNYVNLHTYHYAGNNPVKLVDPDGRTDDIAMGIEIKIVRYNDSYHTLRGQYHKNVPKSERGQDYLIATRTYRDENGKLRQDTFTMKVQSVDVGVYENPAENNTIMEGSFYSRFRGENSGQYAPDVLTPTYAKLEDGRMLDGHGVAQQGNTGIASNQLAHRIHDDSQASLYSLGCIIGIREEANNTHSLAETLESWGVQDGQYIFTKVVNYNRRH